MLILKKLFSLGFFRLTLLRNEVKPQKDLPQRQCKSTQNESISHSPTGLHLLVTRFVQKNSILIGSRF